MPVFYFMLRPPVLDDEKSSEAGPFTVWWRRGRALVFFIFLGMLTTIISILVFVNSYYTNLMAPPSLFCDSTAVQERRVQAITAVSLMR